MARRRRVTLPAAGGFGKFTPGDTGAAANEYYNAGYTDDALADAVYGADPRHGVAYLKAGLEGAVDIVNNYDWTSVPRGSDYRLEAPCAYVTAFELEYGQLQQMIDGYINLATAEANAASKGTDPGMEFYKNIYKPKGAAIGTYNFPYFGDSFRTFQTEFADTFSNISQRGAKFLGAPEIEGLAGFGEKIIGGAMAGINEIGAMGGNPMSDKIAKMGEFVKDKTSGAFKAFTGSEMPGMQTYGAPGNYIETPQFYQYSNTDSPLDINFVLSNTISDSAWGWKQNHDFITKFTKINRPRRMGAIGMTFPAIYRVEVPGLRYIQWAYLNNFSVGLLGTRRRIKYNGASVIVPEAYSCQFSFKSLTIEAANFVDEVNDIGSFMPGEGDPGHVALQAMADLQKEQNQWFNDRAKLKAKMMKEREDAAAYEATRMTANDLTDKQLDQLNAKYYGRYLASGQVLEAEPGAHPDDPIRYADPDGPGPMQPGGGIDYKQAIEIEQERHRRGEESIFSVTPPVQEEESFVGAAWRRMTSNPGKLTYSDIRLKENIEKIRTSKTGIPVYQFNYKGSSDRYTGTMAQDLIKLGRLEAITKDNKGFYMVDYNKIDVECIKI